MKQLLGILLCMMLALPQKSFAQQPSSTSKKTRDMKMYGRVVDSFTNLAIIDSKITLMTLDSTVVDTCSTQAWNKNAIHPESYFFMTPKVSEGKYIIKVENPKYETTYYNHEISFKTRATVIDLKDLTLKRKRMEDVEHNLGEVVVKSTKIKMINKGDTIVFNAEAFNLPEGSMLDALIRQLPGATMNSNGEIFINGRKLDYLTLNGKDFFKGNNKQLIENLPNYTVKDLKVFEKSTEKSQAMGIDVEKKDYVMDIQLKKQYEKNFIGNADIAGGTNSRYALKLFGLYFTPRIQVSTFANINNVNEDRKPGEKGDWDPTKLPKGQVTRKTIGLNFANSNEKNTVNNSLSTSVSWLSTHNITHTAAESFLGTANNNFTRRINNSTTKNTIYELNDMFRVNKSYQLMAMLWLNYNKFDNFSTDKSAVFQTDPKSLGSTEAILDSAFTLRLPQLSTYKGINRQLSQTLGNGHTLSSALDIYLGKPLKSGDRIGVQVKSTYENIKNYNFSKYQLDYLQEAGKKDYRNRYDESPSYTYSYTFNPQYIFVLPSGFNIITGYEYRQAGNYRNNNKYRLDRLQEWQNEDHSIGSLPSLRDSLLRSLDLNNSYTGYYMSKQHMGVLGVHYMKRKGKNSFTFGVFTPLSYKKEQLDYRSEPITKAISQSNWIKQINFSGQLVHNEYEFVAWGNSTTTTPDMYSLIDRRDNSNPLAISLGNPNLKNGRQSSLGIRFSDKHNRRYNLPSIYFGIQETHNAVANGFIYDSQTGVYTYKPENVNGNWSAHSEIYYNVPLDSMKYFNLFTETEYNYDHNVDLTGVAGQTSSVLSKVNNHTTRQHLEVKYQKETLSLSLMGQISWRNVNSTRKGFTPFNTYDYEYGFIGSYSMKTGLEMGMDLKMFSRRGYVDEQINTNNLMCNAYVTQSFMKGRFAVKLEAFDLFHQLKSVDYQVNGQGKSEIRYNTIPHYIMLHAIYKMNVGGKK